MRSASRELHQSAFWHEVSLIPQSIELTLAARNGFGDVANLLERATGRIFLVGNGASSYICHTLAICALGMRLPAPVMHLPVGMLSGRKIPLRAGDTMVFVSQSGEMRDLVQVMDRLPPDVNVGLLTANGASSLAQRVNAVATISILGQDAITHTQAYCASTVALLAIAAEAANDRELAAVCATAAELALVTASGAEDWAAEVVRSHPSPRSVQFFGSDAAWPAAIESALLVKELAILPSEGSETREAATAVMTALTADDLVVSVPTADRLDAISETERLCASRGATVRRLPAAIEGPPELAGVSSFCHAAALAGLLAAAAGHPLDQPAWVTNYNATARLASEPR